LALCLALVALSAGQLAYRLAQPTDGWHVETTPSNEMVLLGNLLGAPSPLQAGDAILAMGGLSTTLPKERLFAFDSLLPPGWAAGASVPYEVRRAGQVLTLQVPLYHWRAAPLLARLFDPFNLGGPCWRL
jgi:hypothetical protein